MVAVPTSPAGYPMVPSAEVWAALSPAQRAAVVAALPGEVTYDEMAWPEGDRHVGAKDERNLQAWLGHKRIDGTMICVHVPRCAGGGPAGGSAGRAA